MITCPIFTVNRGWVGRMAGGGGKMLSSSNCHFPPMAEGWTQGLICWILSPPAFTTLDPTYHWSVTPSHSFPSPHVVPSPCDFISPPLSLTRPTHSWSPACSSPGSPHGLHSFLYISTALSERKVFPNQPFNCINKEPCWRHYPLLTRYTFTCCYTPSARP